MVSIQVVPVTGTRRSMNGVWGRCGEGMWCYCCSGERASNAFFGTDVNESVYFFVCGFRLAFAVFMDGDLPSGFSAASFVGERTIVLH